MAETVSILCLLANECSNLVKQHMCTCPASCLDFVASGMLDLKLCTTIVRRVNSS